MTPHPGFLSRAALLFAALLAGTGLSSAQGSTSVSGGTVESLAPTRNLAQTRTLPPLLQSSQTQRLGQAERGQHLQVELVLPIRNEPELDRLLVALYDKSSPLYHHYLSSAEFDARFAPTPADYNTLVTWARNHGLSIVRTSTNRRLLTVDGSVDALNQAFNVTLTQFHDAVAGRTFFAPDQEPSTDLPIPLHGITGLDNAYPPVKHLKNGNYIPAGSKISRRDEAISAIAGSGPGNTYLPTDMRAAYYGTGTLTGAGQTVGIFSFDGYLASDLALWYQTTGTSSSVPVNNVLVGGYSGACIAVNGTAGSTCEDDEQILDILQVQGMAPGLTQILFYEGSTANPILNQMVIDNTAKILSSSWGGGGFGTSSDVYFKQMATQGQTFLNATGDSGGFNNSTWSAPSTDQYILQVGGTDLTTSSAGGPWSGETGWADSGGGTHTGYAIPTWQQTAGVITAANGGSSTLRNSPDIAAEANFDNTTVNNGVFLSGYGGTSYATPRLAGYLALANQQSVAGGGSTIGFINPILYSAGLSASAATVYHDITSGSNTSTTGSPKVTFNAVAGYDLVTGWGSPNGPGLINLLAPDAFTLSTSSQAVTVARSSSVTLNVTVTAVGTFNSAVTLSATGLPSGVTAQFNPATPTPGTPTTLTLTADATPVANTLSFNVYGVSGSLSASTPVTLNMLKRAGFDFTLSAATASPTVVAGSPTTDLITVTRGSGLPQPVTLSLNGLPAAITASWDVNPTNGPANLSFTTPIYSLGGTYPLTLIGGIYPPPLVGNNYGLMHSIPLTLTVTPAPNLVGNPGFETGTAAPWTSTSGVVSTGCANSGNYCAYMDGYGQAHTDTLSQPITITAGKTKATLSYFLAIGTAETTTTLANDTLTVQLLDTGGNVLTTLATYSNLNKSGYLQRVFDVSAYIGQTVTLKFTGVENASLATAFYVDDVAVNVQ